MPRIFINFRNGDGEWAARLLKEKLVQRYGKHNVFLSSDSIALGDDFPAALENAARTCDVLLALVGPSWLTITDEHGNQRIFAEDDWVHREIAIALAADRIVLAVLLGNTSQLKPDDLPDDIRELANRQGWRLDRKQFEADYAGLEERLMEEVPVPEPMAEQNTTDGISLTVGKLVDGDVAIWDIPEGSGRQNLSGTAKVSEMLGGNLRGVNERERQPGKEVRG